MGHILVTGGAGFIGSHFGENLLRAGREPVLLDTLNDSYNPQFKRDNLENVRSEARRLGIDLPFYQVDISDQAAMNQVFSQHDIEAVIHLAASAGVRPSLQNPAAYVQNNINGTVSLLEAMRQHGVGRLVFASSSSVYGANEKIPFAEDDFVDHPISPYAATKKAGELLCHTYHHVYQMSVVCLRFFTVYGPRQRPDLAIYKFTDLLFRGEPIPFYGDGSSRRDYTYIDDIISGIAGALNWVGQFARQFEVFNLGESKTISLREMLDGLETITARKAILNHLPRQPGDVEATFADINKARKILGYAPATDFNDGLHRFIDWYKRNRLSTRP